MLFCCTPAFASGWQSTYMAEIKSIYRTVLVLARCGSAVVLAYGAIEFLVASGAKQQYEQKLEKAKMRIVYALIALAALYLLPAVVQMGLNIGRSLRWNPDPASW